ncbi:MAG TPA: DUF2905 domain-containing protein [Candidatus Hydrogenedentes bacterium]|nr:DUF2905 domain-containing protein [Candidatus Hydrogenedentota bacterium]
MISGLGLIVVGGAIWLLAKSGLPLGRLPGDIHVEGRHSSFHLPLVTCLVISAVLTLLLNLALWLFRK